MRIVHSLYNVCMIALLQGLPNIYTLFHIPYNLLQNQLSIRKLNHTHLGVLFCQFITLWKKESHSANREISLATLFHKSYSWSAMPVAVPIRHADCYSNPPCGPCTITFHHSDCHPSPPCRFAETTSHADCYYRPHHYKTLALAITFLFAVLLL